MTRYVLVVMTNAEPGQEAEFNRWYTDVHMPEICTLLGFQSARRFKHHRSTLSGGVKPDMDYLAIYEIETSDINAAIKRMLANAARVQGSSAIQARLFSEFYEQIAEFG